MAEQAYAYVTLIPVAKGFQSAVAKEMGGVNNVGKKAGADAGTGFKGGFGGALKGIAAVAGTALAAVGVGRFFGDAVNQANDLSESLNAVNVAYGESAANIVKLGEDAATRLGVTQSDFNAAAVRFSAFADRVVGEGGNVGGFVDDITTRAADFASVFNIDVSEALQVFQSGLSGEAEPLKRFGINLLDSEVQAYALANGIGEVGRALTEDEKVQARYGLLLESTAKTAGDFANTSDGLANSQRILQANFGDMQAAVGNALLPTLANLSAAMLPLVEQLGPILTGTLEELSPVITDLAGQIPGLLESFLPMIPVIGELAGIFLELAADLLPVFVDLIMALMPIFTELAPVIAEFIGDAMEILVPILVQLIDALIPIVEALLPVFMELFEALAPVALELIEAMLPLIDLLLPLLIDFLEFLTPILIYVAEIFGDILVASVGFFADSVEWITGKIEEFSDFFETVWNGVKSFFQDIINGLIGGFEGFVNGAIRGVNRVVDAINSLSFTVPDWVPELGGRSFGFNLRRLSEISLPRVALAEGGLVTSPTNALIGEAGPEVVIPLDRFERMMGDSANAGRSINYYAAPNKSFDAEQELRLAMQRVRVLA